MYRRLVHIKWFCDVCVLTSVKKCKKSASRYPPNSKARTSGSVWERLGSVWERLGGVWERLGASGSVWERLGVSGSVWELLGASDASGSVWEAFGSVWERLEAFGSVWEAFGNVWERLGPSGRFGRVWKSRKSIKIQRNFTKLITKLISNTSQTQYQCIPSAQQMHVNHMSKRRASRAKRGE